MEEFNVDFSVTNSSFDANFGNVIKGDKGNPGATGAAGKDGVDGVSPTISVSNITGGHRITITDKNETKYVDVMDGTDGEDGKDGSNGTNGKDGTSVTITNISESTTDGGSNVVTFSNGQTLTVKNGNKGGDGADGEDYILTEADIQKIAEKVENVTFYERPTIVSSVAEMVDTSKDYVLESTGTIWKYKKTSVTQTITEKIVGTTDNPYSAGRLSSGNPNGASNFVTTPYIDLQKYSVPFKLHLRGIPFSKDHTNNTELRYSQYDTSKTHLKTEMICDASFITFWSGADFIDNGDGTCDILFTPPVTNKSVNVGYARFSGQGTEANANVYITYEGTTTDYSWVDTGVVYGGDSSGTIEDIAEFTLVNPSVKAFMETADYNDNDYSSSNVSNYASADYFRKDMPFPIILGWERTTNAVQYAVSIDGQIYYTNDNTISIYNLIPNKTYSYKVTALCADGSKVLIKSNSFKTKSVTTRMLNIDGIQNVRDIGGYVGVNSKKVNYGLLYRGSAMDEAIQSTLRITDNGKQEMVARVGIKTDLDLRGANNVSVSALGNGVDFYTPPYSYLNYADAITNSQHRGYFKTMLEYIVAQLTANKPVYIHCSGGCDRTGTLVFLLLGLLGVSESDLAKEYELSSFSKIGQGRQRNSTVYDYKGMVAAIKAYSGTTITDKFVAFATDCGVTSDTITSFRNLMLG